MREGHRRLELLLGEMNGIVARVTTALARDERPALAPAPAPAASPEVRGAEMADALAAAVERLRARAEATPLEAPSAGVGAAAGRPGACKRLP